MPCQHNHIDCPCPTPTKYPACGLSSPPLRFVDYYSGESFLQLVPQIEATHHPLMIRTPDQNPWQVTTNEAEQVLHDYAPSLSIAISGSTMVVFKEKQ